MTPHTSPSLQRRGHKEELDTSQLGQVGEITDASA